MNESVPIPITKGIESQESRVQALLDRTARAAKWVAETREALNACRVEQFRLPADQADFDLLADLERQASALDDIERALDDLLLEASHRLDELAERRRRFTLPDDTATHNAS